MDISTQPNASRRRRILIAALVCLALIPLAANLYRLSESNRFARTLALRFGEFPREVYPDAPPAWTNWTDVVRDRATLKAFAARELDAVRGAGREDAYRVAEDYMADLLITNPHTLRSVRLPDGLPEDERAECLSRSVRAAHARGDYVSDALPRNLKGCAARLRTTLAVQFDAHGWRDWFATFGRQ